MGPLGVTPPPQPALPNTAHPSGGAQQTGSGATTAPPPPVGPQPGTQGGAAAGTQMGPLGVTPPPQPALPNAAHPSGGTQQTGQIGASVPPPPVGPQPGAQGGASTGTQAGSTASAAQDFRHTAPPGYPVFGFIEGTNTFPQIQAARLIGPEDFPDGIPDDTVRDAIGRQQNRYLEADVLNIIGHYGPDVGLLVDHPSEEVLLDTADRLLPLLRRSLAEEIPPDDPELQELIVDYTIARTDVLNMQGSAVEAMWERVRQTPYVQGNDPDRQLAAVLDGMQPTSRANLPEFAIEDVRNFYTTGAVTETDLSAVNSYLGNIMGIGYGDSLSRYRGRIEPELYDRLYALQRRDRLNGGIVSARVDLIDALLTEHAIGMEGGPADLTEEATAERGRLKLHLLTVIELYERDNGFLDQTQSAAFLHNLLTAEHRNPNAPTGTAQNIPVMMVQSPDDLTTFQRENLSRLFGGVLQDEPGTDMVLLYQTLVGMGYPLQTNTDLSRFEPELTNIADRMRQNAIEIPNGAGAQTLVTHIVQDGVLLQAARAGIGTAVGTVIDTAQIGTDGLIMVGEMGGGLWGFRHLSEAAFRARNGLQDLDDAVTQVILPPYATAVTELIGAGTEAAIDTAITTMFTTAGGGALAGVGPGIIALRQASVAATAEAIDRGIPLDDHDQMGPLIRHHMMAGSLNAAGAMLANAWKLPMRSIQNQTDTLETINMVAANAFNGALNGFSSAILTNMGDGLFGEGLFSEESTGADVLEAFTSSIAGGMVGQIVETLRIVPPDTAEMAVGTLVAGILARGAGADAEALLTDYLMRLSEEAGFTEAQPGDPDELVNALLNDRQAKDYLDAAQGEIIESMLDAIANSAPSNTQ